MEKPLPRMHRQHIIEERSTFLNMRCVDNHTIHSSCNCGAVCKVSLLGNAVTGACQANSMHEARKYKRIPLSFFTSWSRDDKEYRDVIHSPITHGCPRSVMEKYKIEVVHTP